MAVLKTQGTELYIKDITGTEPVVLKFACPTGVTGLNSGGTDEIDITCLDAQTRSFALGLSDAGELSVPFIFDPAQNSHRKAFSIAALKAETQVCIALSDGTTAPTINSSDLFVAPTSRTSFIVAGLVKNIPIDIAGNEVVRGTMTIRVNGQTRVTFKTGESVVY